MSTEDFEEDDTFLYEMKHKLNTERVRYNEKENINQFDRLINKQNSNLRSRNNGKLCLADSEGRKIKTYKPSNIIKTQNMHKNNPLRMYNTIEDAQFTPQLEQGCLESSSKNKIGPDMFIPIQLLGKGSFGEVYLVKLKHQPYQKYAMKILHKDKIFANNLVRYATTERNVLSYFTNHPFIVNLNFAFQTNTKLFLVLDYCPGGDLGQLIHREGYLSEDRAKVYMAEILLAIEDLHKGDVIFRDLKPDNVVIDSEGHALLTDFGLSKEGIYDNKSATSF